MAEKRKIEPDEDVKTEIFETGEDLPDPAKKPRYDHTEPFEDNIPQRKNTGRRTGHKRYGHKKAVGRPGIRAHRPFGTSQSEPVKILPGNRRETPRQIPIPTPPPATAESMQPVVVNCRSEPVIFNRPYRIQANSPPEFQSALKNSVTVNNGLVQATPMVQSLIQPGKARPVILHKPGPSSAQIPYQGKGPKLAPKPLVRTVPSTMKPLNISGKIIKGVQLKSIKVTLNKKKT